MLAEVFSSAGADRIFVWGSLTEQGHTPIKHERMFVEADPERKSHVTRGGMTRFLAVDWPTVPRRPTQEAV